MGGVTREQVARFWLGTVVPNEPGACPSVTSRSAAPRERRG